MFKIKENWNNDDFRGLGVETIESDDSLQRCAKIVFYKYLNKDFEISNREKYDENSINKGENNFDKNELKKSNELAKSNKNLEENKSETVVNKSKNDKANIKISDDKDYNETNDRVNISAISHLNSGDRDMIIDSANIFEDLNYCTTAECMIQNEMYAIDENEEIIKTGGMVSFRLTDEVLQSQDEFSKTVSLCVPIPRRKKFDDKMILWQSVRNTDEKIRWRKMEGKVSYDKNDHCYKCIFEINSLVKDVDGYYRVNVDRGISVARNTGRNEKIDALVYFSTFKNYNFFDVSINRLDFSAKVGVENDEKFVFVADKRMNIGDDYFIGKFERNGITKTLKVKLAKCDKLNYKGNVYYKQLKETNYFIDDVEYNKKGFWAWIKRIFKKTEDNY